MVLKIETEDHPGMLARLTEAIAKHGSNIRHFEADTLDTGRGLVEVVVRVHVGRRGCIECGQRAHGWLLGKEGIQKSKQAGVRLQVRRRPARVRGSRQCFFPCCRQPALQLIGEQQIC